MDSRSHPVVSEQWIASCARDGAVLIKGLFTPFLEQLRAGVERNIAEPGPYAAVNLKAGDTGRFFDDYCSWTRISECAAVVLGEGVANAAAARPLRGAPRSHLAALSRARHGERAPGSSRISHPLAYLML